MLKTSIMRLITHVTACLHIAFSAARAEFPEHQLNQTKQTYSTDLWPKMSRTGNDAGNELSDFEKQRQENIAERDALLKKLTQEAQSSGLFTQPLPTRAVGNNAKPQKKKPPVKKVKEEEAPGPRRVSSRLRGIAAESEVAKRKAEEEYEGVQEDQRAKRIRKSDSFTYDDMVVWGQKLSGDSLIGTDVVTKGVAKPYGRTFGEENIKETTDKDLKTLREEMSGLRLWDAWEPNRANPAFLYCRYANLE